ncbi:hypothetical protein C8J57DRAFT_1516137 [Mycena rebaudengoi]|nr:hypothetical protein C8J57DRAFT_1516137 [Mycena rebaudengoi]
MHAYKQYTPQDLANAVLNGSLQDAKPFYAPLRLPTLDHLIEGLEKEDAALLIGPPTDEATFNLICATPDRVPMPDSLLQPLCHFFGSCKNILFCLVFLAEFAEGVGGSMLDLAELVVQHLHLFHSPGWMASEDSTLLMEEIILFLLKAVAYNDEVVRPFGRVLLSRGFLASLPIDLRHYFTKGRLPALRGLSSPFLLLLGVPDTALEGGRAPRGVPNIRRARLAHADILNKLFALLPACSGAPCLPVPTGRHHDKNGALDAPPSQLLPLLLFFMTSMSPRHSAPCCEALALPVDHGNFYDTA